MTQQNGNVASPWVQEWSPRRVILATITIAFVLLVFFLLYRFWAVLFIFAFAILVGTALRPAVDWLSARKIPRLHSQILVYILLLALIVGFILLALPLILEQVTLVSSQVSDIYGQVRAVLVQSPSDILQSLGFRLPTQFEVEDLVQNPAPGTAGPQEPPASMDTVSEAFQYSGLIIRGLFTVIAIFLMSFYWMLEGDRAVRSFALLAPANHREDLRNIIQAIELKLGAFLLGQLILCLAIGILQLIAYLIIGLPNALVLAIFAGVMEAVPTIGPILGAIPAILVAATIEPGKVIWVLVATVIIQQIENNLLVPRVMDKSVGVRPLVTLLALAGLSSVFGLAGAVLAIPIAAIVRLLINRFVVQPDETAQIEFPGRDRLSYLRYQAQEIAQDSRKLVRYKDGDTGITGDPLEEAIEELANDLDRLLSQANYQEENTR
jgi:predicted PurR-regulated permease PerM